MNPDTQDSSGSASSGSSDMHERAGEYVLGILSIAERRALDERLRHDETLRAAVQTWEDRLLPLTALVEPVPPSSRLWDRIERSVNARPVFSIAAPETSPAAAPAAGNTQSWWSNWNSLNLWRTLTAGSFATAAVLAVVLATRVEAPPAGPQFMVVLVAPQDKEPGWVIQANMSKQISLTPLATAVVPRDKALEFWTKADGWSGPVSLGLVKPGESVRIPLDKLPPLQPNQLFELTLEPATGSPIGKPTGPIQFIGRAVKVM